MPDQCPMIRHTTEADNPYQARSCPVIRITTEATTRPNHVPWYALQQKPIILSRPNHVALYTLPQKPMIPNRHALFQGYMATSKKSPLSISSTLLSLPYTCGRWQMTGGRWKVADGRWQLAGGRWQVTGGLSPRFFNHQFPLGPYLSPHRDVTARRPNTLFFTISVSVHSGSLGPPMTPC